MIKINKSCGGGPLRLTHSEAILEGEEGVHGYLLIQLTTRRESTIVRLFLRGERELMAVPVDTAHHQEGVKHSEVFLEGEEGAIRSVPVDTALHQE